MISDTIITKILFIDKSVSDYDVVMSSLNNNTLGILYNAETTRNEVITTIQNINININININVDRIGFFCHENANTFLENQTFFGFTDDVLVEKNDNTLFIINLIQTLNLQNIDFLACNTLQHNSWKLFYKLLHLETNVIVGASNDETGNIKYGGDWILESTGEDISNVYFSSNIDYYRYLLTQLTVTYNTINTTYINNTTHTSVVVESVTYIKYQKFKGNSNITSVTFNQPTYVTTIESYAFQYCSRLRYVIGMNEVGAIGWEAFSHNFEMGTLYLPKVYSVGGQAFWKMFLNKTGTHASNIVFHNDTIAIDSSTFQEIGTFNLYRLKNGIYYKFNPNYTISPSNFNPSLSNWSTYWITQTSSTNIFEQIYPLLGFDPSWNMQIMPSSIVANNTTITVRLTFNCVIFTNQMITANTDVSLNPITCGTLGRPITRDGLIWDISFNSAATGYFSNASIIFSKSSGVLSVGNSGTINSSASFTVGTPPPPNLSNFTIPNLEYGVDNSFNLISPNTDSTGAITYSILSSVPANIITLTGLTIDNIAGAGTVTIRASQAATATYNSGTIDATFTIDKAATSLSNFNLPTLTYGVDTSFNLTAPTSTNTGGGPFRYTSSNSSVATIPQNATITLSAAPSFSNYITNPTPFKTSANGGTLPSGQISGIAFSADETKVVISEFINKKVAYSLYNDVLNTWSDFTTISPATDVSGNYLGCSLTPDGNVGVVSCFGIGLCYFFKWNGTGYTTLTQTLDNNKRQYTGIDITADGSRIVAIANDSNTSTVANIYIATWIDASNNYSAFTVSAGTTDSIGFAGGLAGGIGISNDGSRIAFSNGSTSVYWASWDAINKKYGTVTQINGTTTSGNGRQIRFYNGTNMIFYSSFVGVGNPSLQYSTWNSGSSAYNNFVGIGSASVPEIINAWGLFISDSGTIYILDHSTNPSPIFKTNITNLSITYGNKVTILNAGNTTITARQMASTNYRAATITNTLTVNQASTSITGSFDGTVFTDGQTISKPYGNANVSLSATSNRIGTFAFNYTSNDTNVAEVIDNAGAKQIRIKNTGATIITISQDVSSNYLAGSTYFNLTVNQITTAITGSFDGSVFANGQSISKTYGISDVSLSASSASSGNFTYVSDTTDVAEIVDIAGTKKIRIKKVGAAKITISQDASGNYLGNSTFFNLTINQGSTLITGSFDETVFTNGQSISKTYGIPDVSLSATSISDGNFTYISDATDVAEVVDIAGAKKIRIKKSGNAKITINQDASGNYLGNSIFFNLTVGKATPTITFNKIEKTYNTDSLTINLTDVSFNPTSNSEGAFSYSIFDTEIATVSGTIISILKAGKTTITLTQAGSDKYESDVVTVELNINRGIPTITFNKIEKTYNADSLTIDLSSNTFKPISNSEGAFSYSIFDTEIATVSGSTISILKAGETTITLTQAESDKYTSFVVDAELNIIKGTPTISFNDILKKYDANSTTINLSDNEFKPSSNSNGAFSYSIPLSGIEIATVSGSTISILKAGTTNIILYQAESDNYIGLEVTKQLRITKDIPVITFNKIEKTYNADSLTIDLSSNTFKPISNSEGAFSYSIFDTEIATVSGSTISILKAGETTITLTQAESDKYIASVVTVELNINRGIPTIIKPADIYIIYAVDISFNIPNPISNSNGAFSYSISSEGVANISENVVTIVGAGEKIITVNQAISDKYVAGTTNFKLIVSKGPTNVTGYTDGIVFTNGSSITKIFGSNPIILTSTSNRIGTFNTIYSSSNTAIVDISYNSEIGYTAIIKKGGRAIITMKQEESDNYLQGSTSFELLVDKDTQNLSNFPDLYNVLGQDLPTITLVNPTSKSDGAFSYVSSDTNVATISGNTVTVLQIGQTTITAIQEATTDYVERTITCELVVKTYPTLSFNNIIKIYGDENFEIDNTLKPSSNSNGDFSYEVIDKTIADISGNSVVGYSVIIKTGGTTIIRATQVAKDYYLEKSIECILTINRANPFISIFPNLYNVLGKDSPTIVLVRPQTYSDGDFIYTSSNTEVATIFNNIVTVLKIGEITITATQQETINYLGGTITCTLVVKAYPILSFNNIIKTYGDENFKIENTLKPSSQSNGEFSYEVVDTSIAVISGNSLLGYTVTIKKGGSTQIRAIQAAKDYYLDNSINCILTVNRAATIISDFYNSIEKRTTDIPFELLAPRSSRIGDFIYTSSNTAVATISGKTVTIRGAGSTTIMVKQERTDNYEEGTITTGLTVNKTLTVMTNFYASNIEKRNIDEPFALLAPPTSNRPGEFIYSSSNTAVAIISGNMVTIIGAGSTTITATQSETDTYAQGTIATILTIKIYPTISNFPNIEKSTIDISFNLLPISDSNGAFNYSSSNESVASIFGNKVIIKAAGQTIITLIQAAKDNYSSGSATCVLTVKKYPTISNFPNIEKNTSDLSFNLIPPDSDSSGTFTYSSSDPTIATISANKVTILRQGTVTITATQAAKDEYSLATITNTLTVKIYPTISNFPNIFKTYGDDDFYLPIPDSSSIGGAFTYSSSDNKIAAVFNGNRVRIFKSGLTTIEALQETTDTHSSGTITCTLLVSKLEPTITFDNIIKTFGDDPFTLDPISLSPGLFTYVSYNPLVATISGNIVTIVGHGTTTIEVSQMETTNYLPKTVACELTVNRANPVLINTYINTFGNLHQIDLNTNSDGTFSLTSDNPLVATTFRNETTFENEITIVGAGTVKIDAIQEELNNYNAKTITCNLKINKANSTIDDFENITKNYNDEPFRLLEPNSNSDGYFTYSSSNTAVASILEDIVTIRGTGTTVITAVQEETHIFKEGTISCILTVL